ncbi:MAG TPA: ATP-binding protein [Polyangiaceae bacterium]
MTERAPESTEPLEPSDANEPLDTGRYELESGPVPRELDPAVAYRELLDLATGLPVEAGPTPVTRSVLDRLAALMPRRAIGTCIALEPTGEPIVEMYLPRGVPAPGRDPTRLFPELPEERIFPLAGLPGSTLHFGCIAEPIVDYSVEHEVMVRAAALLAAGIRTSLALRTAGPVSVEVTALRSQVIQSEKLASLGQLVAGVVHELANPVTSIVACTDVLLRKHPKDAPGDDLEHLRRIGLAADRILKFSRDLVAYARPATEVAGPVALHEVIAQAHAFCEHEFGRHNVNFNSDFADGSPPVLGQSGPLTQVFVNLFTNAAHAMSEHGGRLEVRTRHTSGEPNVHVEVTDTGTGIPPEAISKVFEPFFTTKEKGRGTGLGLSIVQEIMAAHGGEISAASTLGEGTTFSLTLPVFATPER